MPADAIHDLASAIAAQLVSAVAGRAPAQRRPRHSPARAPASPEPRHRGGVDAPSASRLASSRDSRGRAHGGHDGTREHARATSPAPDGVEIAVDLESAGLDDESVLLAVRDAIPRGSRAPLVLMLASNALAEVALPRELTSRLLRLSLAHNCIDRVPALGGACPLLQSLDLAGNAIGSLAELTRGGPLPALARLSLKDNCLDGPACLSGLGPRLTPGLRDLDVSGNLVARAESLAPLRGLPLEAMCLDGNPLTRRAAAHDEVMAVLDAGGTGAAGGDETPRSGDGETAAEGPHPRAGGRATGQRARGGVARPVQTGGARLVEAPAPAEPGRDSGGERGDGGRGRRKAPVPAQRRPRGGVEWVMPPAAAPADRGRPASAGESSGRAGRSASRGTGSRARKRQSTPGGAAARQSRATSGLRRRAAGKWERPWAEPSPQKQSLRRRQSRPAGHGPGPSADEGDPVLAAHPAARRSRSARPRRSEAGGYASAQSPGGTASAPGAAGRQATPPPPPPPPSSARLSVDGDTPQPHRRPPLPAPPPAHSAWGGGLSPRASLAAAFSAAGATEALLRRIHGMPQAEPGAEPGAEHEEGSRAAGWPRSAEGGHHEGKQRPDGADQDDGGGQSPVTEEGSDFGPDAGEEGPGGGWKIGGSAGRPTASDGPAAWGGYGREAEPRAGQSRPGGTSRLDTYRGSSAPAGPAPRTPYGSGDRHSAAERPAGTPNGDTRRPEASAPSRRRPMTPAQAAARAATKTAPVPSTAPAPARSARQPRPSAGPGGPAVAVGRRAGMAARHDLSPYRHRPALGAVSTPSVQPGAAGRGEEAWPGGSGPGGGGDDDRTPSPAQATADVLVESVNRAAAAAVSAATPRPSSTPRTPRTRASAGNESGAMVAGLRQLLDSKRRSQARLSASGRQPGRW